RRLPGDDAGPGPLADPLAVLRQDPAPRTTLSPSPRAEVAPAGRRRRGPRRRRAAEGRAGTIPGPRRAAAPVADLREDAEGGMGQRPPVARRAPPQLPAPGDGSQPWRLT